MSASEQFQDRALRPIYEFLDTYNYTKALKLTYASPQNKWPITIALRAHCLERCGKKLDACRELRILVSVLSDGESDGDGSGNGEQQHLWGELDEMIWLLGLGTEGEKSTVGMNDTSTGGGGGGGKSSASNNTKGKGKKGKGKSSSSASNKKATASSTVAATTVVTKSPLEMIHIHDLPKHKRQEILSSSKYIANSFSLAKIEFKPIDVADETVIATIAVSLGSLGLYQTTAQLYSSCITKLAPKNATLNQFQREDLCTTLIQGYQSQLKWITTQQQVVTKSKTSTTACRRKKDDELHSARNVLRSWEEAQLIAMSLIKYSGSCSLYKSWCAFASIQHWKSCNILSDLLKDENEDGNGNEKVADEKKKIQQKLLMLPRLAEMLMKQVCTIKDNDDNGTNAGNEFPPSADDWRLYIECLNVQEKYSDAIDILSTIRCGTDKQGRQIDDQNDVTHHLGSLIQLSERERIEMIADLNVKVGKLDVVTKLYSENLMDMLPDQWAYWEALMKYSLDCHNRDFDSVSEECNFALQRVLEKQERLRGEGKTSRVPLRGPHLFRVHMVAEGIRHCNTNDVSGLSKAIEEYGNMFSPQVNCCFQDLRPYIELMVQKSNSSVSNDGHISEELSQMMKWAREIRNANNPYVQSQEGVTESLDETKERMSKLRAYIFTVKFGFELWYQILEQIDGDNANQRKAVDEFFLSSLPSADEMIQLSENVLTLGSNSNDGGEQKQEQKNLPGDDLILLASQLLIHQTHNQDSEEKEYISFLAATLLEKAIGQSPYNPYLKMAAINIYVKNSAATRAWEIFNKLNVVHIQLDSCSYFILGHLINNGLYNEAINQAGKIVHLHSISGKDVCKFIPKSFENGNLQKGLEMISWQRYEMNHSLQLLEAKGLIMDLAPLLTNDEVTKSNLALPSCLGAHHGICGDKTTDVIRAEKIARDTSNYYAAPSLIELSNYVQDNSDSLDNNNNASWSDNRDFTVNQYEILEKTNYPLSSLDSISRAHVHAVLTKTVLLVGVAKAPKKGKVAKYSNGDDLDIRVQSVIETIQNAEMFISNSNKLSDVHIGLWKAMLQLSRTICTLSTGRCSIEEKTKPANDSLSTRETKCVEVLNLANQQINEAINAWKLMTNENDNKHMLEILSKILAELLVPTFALIRTVTTLFALFSWSKRKRNTKVAVGALADTALSFKKLVQEMNCRILEDLPSSPDDEKYKNDILRLKNGVMKLISLTLPQSSSFYVESEKGNNLLDQIVEYKAIHKCSLRKRIGPFLTEMIDELDTFDVQE